MVPRRTFLFTAGGAVLSYAAPPADQVTLGVIGAGGRGTLVMTTFQKDTGVRVGAICDVYEPNLEKAASVAALQAQALPQLQGPARRPRHSGRPHRHARALARADGPGRARRRQGRLRREAALPHAGRGRRAGRGRKENEEHRPGRDAAPQLRPLPAGPRHRCCAANSGTSAWCVPGG